MSSTRPSDLPERDALFLLEEAVQLLRLLPARAWIAYLCGAGAWVLAFLWFWAAATWFAPSGGELALQALGLTVAFGALKLAQARLCAHLAAARSGSPVARWGARECIQLSTTEIAGHAPAIALLPLASLLTFPLGWVWSWFQTRTVLAASAGGPLSFAKVREVSTPALKQIHFGMLYLSAFYVVVLVNVGVVCAAAPRLANSWLGIDTFAAFGGVSIFNTTYFASIGMLAWLVLDPLCKAFFVLRVFYLRSEQNGDDLRLAVRAAAARRTTTLACVLLCLLALGTSPQAQASIATPPEVPAAVEPGALGRGLERTFNHGDFAWRTRPARDLATARRVHGPVEALFEQAWKTLIRGIDAVVDTWNRLRDWWRSLFPKDKDEKESPGSPSSFAAVADVMLIVLLVLAIGLLGFLVFASLKKAPSRAPTPFKTGRAVPAPDLRDGQIHAAMLPWLEWLALARKQQAAGEWRLALRALFLAQLARHADEGLLALARHKTNLEYEHELRRRLPGASDRQTRFRGQRLLFEAVWYGDAGAEPLVINAWLADLEGAR
jgi:hypothetical protein